MPKFLIELEHESDFEACKLAVKTVLSYGSHFLTNAEWGCEDNEHKCWIIVEVDTKDEARYILPPVYRNEAKIVQITRYSVDNFKKTIKAQSY